MSINNDSESAFTISLGAAALTRDIEDLQGLLRASDQALYKAKDRGRNRVESA